MADVIKETHHVMVVLTAQIEFVAHDPSVDGAPPKHKRCGAMQFQGGGAIVPKAWEHAMSKDPAEGGQVVQQLLLQAVERLPDEIISAMQQLGQKAYNGEEPSKLIRPGVQDTMAMRGAQLRKVKPS